MEMLQIVKFIYKKERLNFTIGMQSMPDKPATMCFSSSADLLADLFTEDSEETTDKLLQAFGNEDSDEGAVDA